MKKIIVSLILIPFLSQAALKQGDNKPQVAYVSVNQAVENTGEQKKIRSVLEKERKRVQELIRKKSAEFSKKAVKIRKEMALLSDDEKVKKYEEIQRMQVTMEQFVQEKERAFQQKEAELRANVIERIKQAVAIVAKKEKIRVIENRDGLLWVDPKVDFTNKVVVAYKKKFK